MYACIEQSLYQIDPSGNLHGRTGNPCRCIAEQIYGHVGDLFGLAVAFEGVLHFFGFVFFGREYGVFGQIRTHYSRTDAVYADVFRSQLQRQHFGISGDAGFADGIDGIADKRTERGDRGHEHYR